MARYRFKAASTGGEVIEGEMEARDRETVIEHLRAQGYVPIRAEEDTQTAKAEGARLFRWRRGRVRPRDVILLTRELASLLGARLPIDRALALLAQISPEGASRDFVEEILDQVRDGATLADAMGRHAKLFPNYYVGMIRAGEAGGSLDVVLTRLAEGMEREAALRADVASALRYPVIVIFVAFLSLIFIFTGVIPEFRNLFSGAEAELPLLARGVFAVSEGLEKYGWLIGVILLLGWLTIRLMLRGEQGRLRLHRLILNMSLVGDLVLKIEFARFCRTLGMLLDNGVSHLAAVNIVTGMTENRALAAALSGLGAALGKGEGLSAALGRSRVAPHLVVQLIRVGEESGDLAGMLGRIADMMDDEVRRRLDNILGLLTPVVTIVLGIIVAVIVASMLIAILSTYGIAV